MNKTLIILLVGVVLTGCAKKQASQPEMENIPVTQVIGIGKIVPEGGIIELASPVPGIVTSIPIAEGTQVKKGDILVQLDNTVQALAAKEAAARITTQKQVVESQKWLIKQKETALADKLRKLMDAQDLLKSGATTGENVRTLQNEYDQASLEMKKVESDLSMQVSQLNEIMLQQSVKMNDLNQTELRAPVNGVILDILPGTGEAVSLYQTYARLAPDAPLIIQAEIDEMFAPGLSPGQTCTISLPGESEPVAKGRVIRISADLKKKSLFSDSGEELEDRRVREAEISLDSVYQALLINTKVQCTIQIK